MQSFSTSWNYQKTVGFLDVFGGRERCIGNKWVKWMISLWEYWSLTPLFANTVLNPLKTPENHRVFLVFSGELKWKHWPEMVNNLIKETTCSKFVQNYTRKTSMIATPYPSDWWPSNFTPEIKTKFKDFSGEILKKLNLSGPVDFPSGS